MDPSVILMMLGQNAPDSSALGSTASSLQQYGGWGVSVILMSAIAILWRTHTQFVEKTIKENNEILREVVGASTAQASTNEKIDTTLKAIDRRLEDVERAIETQ